jgi:hypothetical protein
MNYGGIGDPIAKIVDKNQSKRMRNSKKRMVNNPNECEYCKKKTTVANKARHLKICSVKKAGGSSQIISISDPSCLKKPLYSITVKDNEIVQQIPNSKKQRNVYYISGQSGSGKSYFTNQITTEYNSMYPKHKIYLFSLLTEDKSITNKSIKRIKLNENFLSVALTLEDLKNCLIIYDDVDTIKNKPIKNKLFHLLDTILQCGRHSSTSVIYCSHLPCNGNDTKIILAECNSLTIFPSTMGNRNLRYLLSEYFGLDKKEVDRVKKLHSRHITIVRSYPMVLLHEKGAYVLNADDDEKDK